MVSGRIGWGRSNISTGRKRKGKSGGAKTWGRSRGDKLADHSPFKFFRRVRVIGYTQVAPLVSSDSAKNAAHFHPLTPCCALCSLLANNLANGSGEKVPRGKQNHSIST